MDGLPDDVTSSRGTRPSGHQLGFVIARVEPSAIEISVETGESLLDAAVREKLSWPSVCGGSAACSTCMVRIISGLDSLSPPTDEERMALTTFRGIDVTKEPSCRLACQLRLVGDVVVRKLGVRRALTELGDRMHIKVGARLRSSTCDTEVIVVRSPASAVEICCGGAPMIQRGDEPDRSAFPEPTPDGGTLLGKRYFNERHGIELLCTRPGRGELSVNGDPFTVREAKPLPSSD